MIFVNRPNPSDAPPWCPYFFNLVPEDNLMDAFENNRKSIVDLINTIPADKENFRYANDKWTIKEVLIHLLDCERYYAYGAFSATHHESFELGFDRDAHIRNGNIASRNLGNIADEFQILRTATVLLFSNFTDEMLDAKCIHLNHVYTARSFGWMLVGHCIHHINFLNEKYLF